jgi:hypothetical protein
MEFELKNYKFLKIKYYLKKTNFILFFNGTNQNLKNWILIEQSLKKKNLNFYKIHNKLIIKAINNSIYKNLKFLVNGVIIFLQPNTITLLKLKTLITINPLLTLLSIKLNNKFYSISQLKNIMFLNFKKNAIIFYKSLKTFLNIPYIKLKRLYYSK